MNLYYRNHEVTPDMYCLEWYDTIFEGKDEVLNYQFFFGTYAYQKAIIHANEKQITGKVVYCLSKQYQNIIKGEPVKRGAKKKIKRTDFLNNCFTPQMLTEPEHMKPI